MIEEDRAAADRRPSLGAAWWYLSRPAGTRQRVASFAGSFLNCVLGAAIAYEEVHTQFTQAAAVTPRWPSLAAELPPGAVLGRACLHTLARSAESDRSAAELPALGVAQGEARVRRMPREAGPFTEVWRGRWQAGQPGAALPQHASCFSCARLTIATDCRRNQRNAMPDAALYRQIVDVLLAEHEVARHRSLATTPWPGNFPSPGGCTARCTVSAALP